MGEPQQTGPTLSEEQPIKPNAKTITTEQTHNMKLRIYRDSQRPFKRGFYSNSKLLNTFK
ncbi:MAG: hypothetical protein U5J63_03660 [Fodinibius sp.]|nr:hypothetical protein [Fodinibius sp.]